ncbi:MAG: DUF2085 domain-containing protein [Candidatus Dojkabacteria bacterium]|nr:DUF2085 domain-containing protein [Candidatus Dojkabacteria bacterium]
MNTWFEKKLLLIVGAGLTVFTVLPALAPLFAYLGWNFLADPIYWVYQWFCHQRPWRSYHLFDYQYAMDARMMLMFGSMAVSAFVIHYFKVKPLNKWQSFILAILLIAPLGIDGTIQAIAEVLNSSNSIPFYESTNLTRSVVGAIFGVGIAFALFPSLREQNEIGKPDSNFLSKLVVSFLISILFIPVIVFFWGITSNTYKPSSLLIDFEQRFPGYNYEITTSAGHSTIRRLISIGDEQKYIARAEYYDRQDLIEKYETQKKVGDFKPALVSIPVEIWVIPTIVLILIYAYKAVREKKGLKNEL